MSIVRERASRSRRTMLAAAPPLLPEATAAIVCGEAAVTQRRLLLCGDGLGCDESAGNVATTDHRLASCNSGQLVARSWTAMPIRGAERAQTATAGGRGGAGAARCGSGGERDSEQRRMRGAERKILSNSR